MSKKAVDLGVYYSRSGRALVRVEGEPQAGQYAFNEETATYTFSARDDGRTFVKIWIERDGHVAEFKARSGRDFRLQS